MNLNYNNLIIVLVLCLSSASVMAKSISGLTVQVADQNTIAIQISNTGDSEVQVSLKDSYGVVLYNEVMSENNSNQRKYDLQNLPVGDYTITAKYNNVIKTQTVQKGYESVEVISNSAQTIFQPTFRKHSEYVDVSMFCSEGQDISLELIDSDGHVVYSEVNKSTSTVQKRFNLSQLEAGSYTISILVDGDAFYDVFNHSIDWTPFDALSTL